MISPINIFKMWFGNSEKAVGYDSNGIMVNADNQKAVDLILANKINDIIFQLKELEEKIK